MIVGVGLPLPVGAASGDTAEIAAAGSVGAVLLGCGAGADMVVAARHVPVGAGVGWTPADTAAGSVGELLGSVT